MYIEDYLGERVDGFRILNSDGEATGDCPFCGKSKSHWYFHIAQDQRHGRWICFSCDARGDLWKLIAHFEGLSVSKAKAWWIARRNENVKETNADRFKDRLRTLRRKIVDVKQEQVGLPDGFKRIKRLRPKILAERGIELSTARIYNLGYCSEGDMFGRVVFPVKCPLGNSWVARATHNGVKPKYWAGPGAGKLLHGWDVAFRNGIPKRLIISEGPTDVLSLFQAGFHAVDLMGKTIDQYRVSLLRKTGAELLVLLDSEAQAEALEISKKLGSTKIAFLESGDPGDSTPQILRQVVESAISLQMAACLVNRNRIKKINKFHEYWEK